MTNLMTPERELPGPILSAAQLEQIHSLATSLSPEQVIWVSGYFAGLSAPGGVAALAPPNGAALQAPGVPGTNGSAPGTSTGAGVITVLFGSETGNSKDLAAEVAAAAGEKGLTVKIADMADYKPRSLKEERTLLVIASTHGEGDPPQTALDFFEFLEGRKAPKLPELRFSVLALGDSTYEHYCGAGRRVDERLAELGAERLAERVECDVDYEDDAAAWIAKVVEELAAAAPAQNGATGATANGAPAAGTNGGAFLNGAPALGFPANGAPAAAAPAFSKKNPFLAPVMDNLVLTGRGSTKETRHLELSLEGSGLHYRPGDVLGIVPRNDTALVATLLDRLSLSADTEIEVKGEATSLGEALTSRFEITAATPRFLERWAELSGAEELRELSTAERAKERLAFLQGHHILDIIERFPAPGTEPEGFIGGLRPLQPRLYSIASSLEAAPDEVHLTVSTVRYALHDLERIGVASGYLAGIADDEEATVPVYVQSNEHFHLPDDDTPIIMIGAGTGVAPYRSFMQEREARGTGGRSWLFFGERNFRSDFLYQVEWQDLLKGGALSRLDLAFSRDGAEKVYVQDRLREQGCDLYSWLEDGAWLYVCGDAARMAPDVNEALLDLVAEHGGLDREGAEDYLAEMRRDRRYRLDVY